MIFRVFDLFVGVGGFIIVGELVGGYEIVVFCEIDKYV